MAKDDTVNMTVFFDFDNTITTIDVIDDMLGRFSSNERWKELEMRWQAEEIGSRECLKGQIEGIRITKDELDKYLLSVKIDPYFKKLLDLLKSRNIPVLIVSDNFDYILNRILEQNDIRGIDVFCNKADVSHGALNPSFPYSNEKCGDCANCKKTHLLKRKNRTMRAVYVGDGRSDVCASKVSDIVFAKDFLKDFCEKESLRHVAIDSLKDVYDYFVNDKKFEESYGKD